MGKRGRIGNRALGCVLAIPVILSKITNLSLSHPDECPFNEGRLISNRGLDITAHEYDKHFLEEHVPYSSALHSPIIRRRAYFTGPLARYNLNFAQLSAMAQEAARDVGLDAECRNPFKSIIVCSVEMLYALLGSAS